MFLVIRKMGMDCSLTSPFSLPPLSSPLSPILSSVVSPLFALFPLLVFHLIKILSLFSNPPNRHPSFIYPTSKSTIAFNGFLRILLLFLFLILHYRLVLVVCWTEKKMFIASSMNIKSHQEVKATLSIYRSYSSNPKS